MKEIRISRGMVALVDDEDFELVSQYKWHAHRETSKQGERWYAYAIVKMHRLIAKPAPGQVVDHKNGNGLDCCRSNLRPTTQTFNQANIGKVRGGSSRFKGVCWYKAQKRWVAQLKSNGKRVLFAYFDSEVEAAKAYDKKALEYFGEFARLNFPVGGE